MSSSALPLNVSTPSKPAESDRDRTPTSSGKQPNTSTTKAGTITPSDISSPHELTAFVRKLFTIFVVWFWVFFVPRLRTCSSGWIPILMKCQIKSLIEVSTLVVLIWARHDGTECSEPNVESSWRIRSGDSGYHQWRHNSAPVPFACSELVQVAVNTRIFTFPFDSLDPCRFGRPAIIITNDRVEGLKVNG